MKMRVKVKTCDIYVTKSRKPDIFMVLSLKELNALKKAIPKKFQRKMISSTKGIKVKVLNGWVQFED